MNDSEKIEALVQLYHSIVLQNDILKDELIETKDTILKYQVLIEKYITKISDLEKSVMKLIKTGGINI